MGNESRARDGDRPELDARGWPILRSSQDYERKTPGDAVGTAWERHDDPEVRR
jgi:hypothetical protein